MAPDDIFVLVLQLEQYQSNNLMQRQLCGRTITEWVTAAVEPFHHQFVTTKPENDIITLFKQHLTSAKYTVVTYGDMPMLTSQAITQAVDFAVHKQAEAVKLPRGWVFNTQIVAEQAQFKIHEFTAADPTHYLVAFNDLQIAQIRPLLQERINQTHIKHGVTIIDPSHTYIDHSVQIAAGVTIEPHVHLIGQTTIAAGATVLDGSRITDSSIGQNSQIGPYAHLRPGTSIGNDCRIGNFVEIKRSRIGDRTKVAHMTYIGDSTVGHDCNVGCGVIFCNYNGKTKANCLVGDHVFIGSNTCLTAPVELHDHAYIAAGSVITEAVPARALGIARARQAIKPDYVTE